MGLAGAPFENVRAVREDVSVVGVVSEFAADLSVSMMS